MDSEPNHRFDIGYQEQMRLLKRSLSIWRILLYFAVASLAVMTVLGLGFEIIFFGLVIGFWQLALTYDPAYALLLRIFRLNALPPHLAEPPKWYLTYSSILLIVGLIILAFGAVVLSLAGICNQNLVCLVVQHMPR